VTNKGLELIKIAEDAKDIGEYVIANAAVAVVLSDHFTARNAAALGEAVQDGVTLFWVTDDPDGDFVDEVYYDLLGVAIKTDDERRGTCIPVPLLGLNAAITAKKSARSCVREVHDRDVREPNTGEADALWARLFRVYSVDAVERAAKAILNKSNTRNIRFALVNYVETRILNR